jgi:hypothetical protein
LWLLADRFTKITSSPLTKSDWVCPFFGRSSSFNALEGGWPRWCCADVWVDALVLLVVDDANGEAEGATNKQSEEQAINKSKIAC